jgi:hypothetical protein
MRERRKGLRVEKDEEMEIVDDALRVVFFSEAVSNVDTSSAVLIYIC